MLALFVQWRHCYY